MVDSFNRRRFMLAAGASVVATSLPSRASDEASAVKSWDFEADVVIVGSGAAGTTAAIEARRLGKDTLVLEKLLKRGGSSAMSGGVVYAGGGTELQKACGFEDSVEEMYDFIVTAGRKHPHLDKIQYYCEQSIEHFSWLQTMGVSYKPSFTKTKGLPGSDDSLYYSGNELAWPNREKVRPVPRGHVPGHSGWTGGKYLMAALHHSADQLGVRFMHSVSCERLIQERDGRVTGLRVEIDGVVKHVRAKQGVILASGGFIHNREMVKLHAPELYDCTVPWASAADFGMGIQMGIGAGGSAIRMDQGFAILPLYQPDHVLKGIIVNRAAQRFIAEESYHAVVGNEICYRQQGEAYLITDASSQYGYEDYRVEEIARASSIAELEFKLSMPVGALQHNVSYYNEHAEKGRDPLFFKDKAYLAPLNQPPFVAYDLAVDKAFFTSHTFGGLHTTINGEVLDPWGEPIPGLYAAGRTTSGLPTAPYIASGISLGDCTFFGRQAGKQAGGARS